MPRLPRKTKVNVRLCHACHAKCRAKSRGVPGVTGDQASPSTPPSAMSATPATRNDGGCKIVPRLPRETKVDVRLCHACQATPSTLRPRQARSSVFRHPRSKFTTHDRNLPHGFLTSQHMVPCLTLRSWVGTFCQSTLSIDQPTKKFGFSQHEPNASS